MAKAKKTAKIKKGKRVVRALGKKEKTKAKKKAKIEKIKAKEKKEVKKIAKKPLFYLEGIGRRKTSIARVRIYKKGEKKIIVNERSLEDYFPVFSDQKKVLAPLEKLNLENKFFVSIKVKGGGIHSQAEAIRHGLSRALVKFKESFRPTLRQLGYLTRDPRMRERKKFGLKRARRAPQWQKR